METVQISQYLENIVQKCRDTRYIENREIYQIFNLEFTIAEDIGDSFVNCVSVLYMVGTEKEIITGIKDVFVDQRT